MAATRQERAAAVQCDLIEAGQGASGLFGRRMVPAEPLLVRLMRLVELGHRLRQFAARAGLGNLALQLRRLAGRELRRRRTMRSPFALGSQSNRLRIGPPCRSPGARSDDRHADGGRLALRQASLGAATGPGVRKATAPVRRGVHHPREPTGSPDGAWPVRK